MVISSTNYSQRSPVSSPSDKSKLKQRIAWEIKRKLAEKRLEDLTNTNKKRKVEYRDMDNMPLICAPPKEEAANDLYSNIGISASAMERAQEVEANLSLCFPSFLKLMLKSHVTGGFWLGLPSKFCVVHLPKKDETIVLVDENEEKYKTKYLAEKTGLSGGWRGFSIAHKLLEGDALVFQLIERHKFKIYIVRARGLAEVDGAMSLLNLDAAPEPIKTVKLEDRPGENPETTEITRHEYPEPRQLDDDHQEKDIGDDIEYETVDGIKFSESPLTFKDVKCFEDFSIQVDGLIIDSELPCHLRKKYYELCMSRDVFLHEGLMRGLNCKLAAGVISETINIADAIRAATASMAPGDLESWDKTLKAFEDLGMSVRFLLERIGKLLSLSCESQARIDLKRAERGEAEEVMRALEVRLSNVRKVVESLDEEIDALKVKNEELGSMFKEVACAPW